MIFFRLREQKPPPPKRINDDVVMRFDHVYEIAPEKMQLFPQQELLAWDTQRIVASRWDHLAWMHAHWADTVLSGEELDREEVDREELYRQELDREDRGAGS